MSRPPHGKYHDIAVCLSAIATLLLIWLAAQLTDIDTPEPDSAPDPLTSMRADRHQDAAHTSRGSGRRPAPLPAAATQTPTAARRLDGEAKPTAAVGLTPTLRCIRAHESGGDYTVDAWYDGLRYSGAWQFADATWESVTGLPAPASSYPRTVQDRAALELWDGGNGASHWQTAPGCGA